MRNSHNFFMFRFAFFVLFGMIFSLNTAFAQDSKTEGDFSLTNEQARGLYSLLENLKEQKSLFPDEVNARNLYELLDEKYKSGARLTEDGDELVLPANVRLLIYKKSAVIRLSSYFGPKPELSSADCEHLVNEWNSENIFPTAFWSKSENMFVLQYHFAFAGGIHADNLNETLKWFYTMLFDFWDYAEKSGSLVD